VDKGLFEISRAKPIYKNRVAESVQRAAIDVAIEFPAYGQVRAAKELRKKEIIILPAPIILINDFFTFLC